MAELDDTELMAYADGELDPPSMRRVADVVEQDAAAQKKVRAFQATTVLLRAAFRLSAFGTVPQRMTGLLARPRKRSAVFAAGRWRLAITVAAAIGLGLIGFGGGFGLGMQGAEQESSFSDRLLDECADYYVLYARDVAHRVEVAADRRDHIETWLGDRLHRVLHVPDLARYGLAFDGARLLVVDSEPVAQLVYEWPDDKRGPLTICISVGEPGSIAPTTDSREGVNLVLWRAQSYTYIVAGWSDKSMLATIAEDLVQQLGL